MRTAPTRAQLHPAKVAQAPRVSAMRRDCVKIRRVSKLHPRGHFTRWLSAMLTTADNAEGHFCNMNMQSQG
eukprot:CAMPEP_0169307636 /NCGR_PEP_ID=MMETSP1017-20121227/1407_1 /TAXON_ID=342587 /ORGANISM="Karlodinium micrum, Strain CCMP2283" /LENGTH=70 /DNA_ID=CAMNT_0009400955 /DNA_START=24 /DNA_END=232 /DNA_ORIENTATION=+